MQLSHTGLWFLLTRTPCRWNHHLGLLLLSYKGRIVQSVIIAIIIDTRLRKWSPTLKTTSDEQNHLDFITGRNQVYFSLLLYIQDLSSFCVDYTLKATLRVTRQRVRGSHRRPSWALHCLSLQCSSSLNKKLSPRPWVLQLGLGGGGFRFILFFSFSPLPKLELQVARFFCLFILFCFVFLSYLSLNIR